MSDEGFAIQERFADKCEAICGDYDACLATNGGRMVFIAEMKKDRENFALIEFYIGTARQGFLQDLWHSWRMRKRKNLTNHAYSILTSTLAIVFSDILPYEVKAQLQEKQQADLPELIEEINEGQSEDKKIQFNRVLLVEKQCDLEPGTIHTWLKSDDPEKRRIAATLSPINPNSNKLDLLLMQMWDMAYRYPYAEIIFELYDDDKDIVIDRLIKGEAYKELKEKMPPNMILNIYRLTSGGFNKCGDDKRKPDKTIQSNHKDFSHVIIVLEDGTISGPEVDFRQRLKSFSYTAARIFAGRYLGEEKSVNVKCVQEFLSCVNKYVNLKFKEEYIKDPDEPQKAMFYSQLLNSITAEILKRKDVGPEIKIAFIRNIIERYNGNVDENSLQFNGKQQGFHISKELTGFFSWVNTIAQDRNITIDDRICVLLAKIQRLSKLISLAKNYQSDDGKINEAKSKFINESILQLTVELSKLRELYWKSDSDIKKASAESVGKCLLEIHETVDKGQQLFISLVDSALTGDITSRACGKLFARMFVNHKCVTYDDIQAFLVNELKLNNHQLTSEESKALDFVADHLCLKFSEHRFGTIIDTGRIRAIRFLVESTKINYPLKEILADGNLDAVDQITLNKTMFRYERIIKLYESLIEKEELTPEDLITYYECKLQLGILRLAIFENIEFAQPQKYHLLVKTMIEIVRCEALDDEKKDALTQQCFKALKYISTKTDDCEHDDSVKKMIAYATGKIAAKDLDPDKALDIVLVWHRIFQQEGKERIEAELEKLRHSLSTRYGQDGVLEQTKIKLEAAAYTAASSEVPTCVWTDIDPSSGNMFQAKVA